VGGSVNVHKEGLAENIGAITLTCTGGSAGSAVGATLLIGLNANITNRLDASGNVTNISVTVNTGSGATPSGAHASLVSATGITLSGVGYTVPNPSALPVTISVSGIRAAVPSATGSGSIVSGNVFATGLQLANGQLPLLGIGFTSLQASVVNNGIPCTGSAAPVTLDFPGLSTAGTASSAVRVTEAYASSFLPKDPTADTGVRILVNLSGYGANTTVYVPDAIVGNSGSVATSGGEFGTAFNAGVYTPSSRQLLLLRVSGADSTGTGGGSPVAPTSQSIFATVNQVGLVNGAGYAVYEVVDSNPGAIESAQIPVFVVTPAGNCSTSGQALLTPAFAPVSNVTIATQTDPIPRFIAFTPASDCQAIGDCSAGYYPTLSLSQNPITIGGSAQGVPQTLPLQISNSGSGQLPFNLTITYAATGPNWLSANPTSGVNFTNVILTADPTGLAQGQYLANLIVNAGLAGTVTVPVTFNVSAPTPTLKSVVNSATQQAGPIAPGSFATVYGATLTGKVVQVVFNGYPATVVFDAAGQINLLVPSVLSASTPAGVYATIDGVISNTLSVSMAANAPGIFNPGVLNQDNSVNQASTPAPTGSYIQIFMTGLSIAGPVTVNIGTQTNLSAVYAGVVPSIPGLEQVNVQIPLGLTPSGTVQLTVCSQGTCSPAANLYVKAGS
jgi:uncharacterized protein (TIGR03437 family)